MSLTKVYNPVRINMIKSQETILSFVETIGSTLGPTSGNNIFLRKVRLANPTCVKKLKSIKSDSFATLFLEGINPFRRGIGYDDGKSPGICTVTNHRIVKVSELNKEVPVHLDISPAKSAALCSLLCLPLSTPRLKNNSFGNDRMLY